MNEKVIISDEQFCSSFVIVVVKMISALKIFNVKECGQTILFNTRILRICIFTHTLTHIHTRLILGEYLNI